MKKELKFLKLTLLITLISFSCEDTEINRNFSSVPTVFTKKVLLEEFTGSWCGYCPDGAERLEELVNEYDVVGVAIHSQDAMEIQHGVYLEEVYPMSGYPGGMVDRISYEGYVGHNRGWWSWLADQQLQKSAVCGLAINSQVSGDKANIEVRYAFNTEVLLENHKLNVYLVEDNVQGEGYGFDQRNYYNSDTSSTFFNQGDPIIGYLHNNTLRNAVYPNSFGESLFEESLTNMAFASSFQIDISNYNKKNLKVVAFITKVGESVLDHEVLNVQKCDIDGFQDWD